MASYFTPARGSWRPCATARLPSKERKANRRCLRPARPVPPMWRAQSPRSSEPGAPPLVGAGRISSSPLAPATDVAQQSWTKRVAAGEHLAVLQEAEARGLDTCMKQSSLGELAALADAGRYAKRSDVARRALLAERTRFPSSSEAHTAAFLLGRLSEDSSALPDAAVEWYDSYLRESPNGPLASEALGRKMMAL